MGSKERFIFKPILAIAKGNRGIFFSFSKLSVVRDFKLIDRSPSEFPNSMSQNFKRNRVSYFEMIWYVKGLFQRVFNSLPYVSYT